MGLAAVSRAERPDKYGFLAKTDRGLLSYARKQDAIILARVDEIVNKGMYQEVSVTVVDCFKGSLKKGDRIMVIVDAEDDPRRRAIGTLNYFLMKKTREDSARVTPTFFCEWMAVLSFERYGENVGALFSRSTR
jgi:hypothetical protein